MLTRFPSNWTIVCLWFAFVDFYIGYPSHWIAYLPIVFLLQVPDKFTPRYYAVFEHALTTLVLLHIIHQVPYTWWSFLLLYVDCLLDDSEPYDGITELLWSLILLYLPLDHKTALCLLVLWQLISCKEQIQKLLSQWSWSSFFREWSVLVAMLAICSHPLPMLCIGYVFTLQKVNEEFQIFYPTFVLSTFVLYFCVANSLLFVFLQIISAIFASSMFFLAFFTFFVFMLNACLEEETGSEY